MGLTLTGLALFRGFGPGELLRSTNDATGSFLQTFGGMYGVIVAFTIFVVWQQHNDTQIAVEHEAVTLGELYLSLAWFTAWEKRDEVRKRLRSYSKLVPALNGAKPGQFEVDDKQLLITSMVDFLEHPPASPSEERLFGPTLELFHELNEAREHRLTVSRLHLPDGLKWFVYLGGTVCIVAVWVLWVDRPLVHAALTAGMTWVIVAASSLILDLDDPYAGDFVVDWARFNETAARMDALACPAMSLERGNLKE